MKSPIRVTEAEYENRKTGEKATGCTVLIHGEIKAVLDQLMKENPEIKSYGQALAGIVDLGVSVLESQAQAVQAPGRQRPRRTPLTIRNKRHGDHSRPSGWRSGRGAVPGTFGV